jgi:hypothetical protein
MKVGLFGYKSSDGTFQPVRLDSATNSIQTVDYEHHEIHAGSHYFYTDSIELDSAATQVYLFTTPDTTKWIHLTYVATGSAITHVQFYEGADRTGTTLQTVFNNNRNSLNTAGMTVHKDISAGTTDGTLIEQLKSGSSSVQSRSATTAERSNELILKQNTKYLLKFTSGTNDNLCNLQLSWYEHTNIE